MMKKNCFIGAIALCCLVGMSSCVETDGRLQTREYQLETRTPLVDGWRDSVHVSLSFEYPEKSACMSEEALVTVRRSLVEKSFGADYVDVVSVDELLKRFTQDVEAEYKMDYLPLYEQFEDSLHSGEMAMNLSNEHLLTIVPMTEEGRVLSYAVERYMYLGGAHGINNRLLLNYDCSTGRLLTEQDVFVPDSEEAIRQLLLLNLVRQNDDLSLISDIENSGYQSDAIRPNGNFYFSEEGVVYIFNPYEIGPYSLGETDICIPVDEIRPYLNQEWGLYGE